MHLFCINSHWIFLGSRELWLHCRRASALLARSGCQAPQVSFEAGPQLHLHPTHQELWRFVGGNAGQTGRASTIRSRVAGEYKPDDKSVRIIIVFSISFWQRCWLGRRGHSRGYGQIFRLAQHLGRFSSTHQNITALPTANRIHSSSATPPDSSQVVAFHVGLCCDASSRVLCRMVTFAL